MNSRQLIVDKIIVHWIGEIICKSWPDGRSARQATAGYGTIYSYAVPSSGYAANGDILYGRWNYDNYGNRLSESMSTTACTGSPGKAS